MPVAPFQIFEEFPAGLSSKEHDFPGGDPLNLLLVRTPAPSLANAVADADVTEIDYTYLSSRALGAYTAQLQNGVLTVKPAADKTLSSVGGTTGPFRYVVLSNTSGNRLIGMWDYGSELSLANGESLTIRFDQINGVFQVAIAP